jgi:mannose-6-phosphate isomerase-like protein (cupin superfamily)
LLRSVTLWDHFFADMQVFYPRARGYEHPVKSVLRALDPGTSFKVLETQDGVQTAVMRLRSGEASGPLGNEHPMSVQTLVVLSGEVDAQVGSETFWMGAGDSVIVRRGVAHRFVGASHEDAITLNIYAPPAYDDRSPRDRSGEVFQDAFTENGGASREKIAQAQDALEPD